MASRYHLTKNKSFQSFQTRLLLAFVIVLVVGTGILTTVLLMQSSSVIRDKADNLLASNSRQIQLNIDSYMDRISTSVILLYSDEKYYGYDPTDASLTDYDKIVAEEAIFDRIVEIGIMDNFADFAILYPDDSSVGWVSTTTSDLFAEGGIYDYFAATTEAETNDENWTFGVRDNTTRVYYTKRLNEHAVVLVSFYGRELANVFDIPEGMDGMVVRLTDEENQIIYSSDTAEIGSILPEAYLNPVNHETTVDHVTYLVNENLTENGWKVISTIPTNVILKENHQLIRTALIVMIALILVSVTAVFFVQSRLSRPVNGLMEGLTKKATIDNLSEVMNKASFMEAGDRLLEEYRKNGCVAVFAMIDMDNFKRVNDTLGHAFGDQVIHRMGSLAKTKLPQEMLIGRIGGDEFAIFGVFSGTNIKDMEQVASRIFDQFRLDFAGEFAEEQKTCSVTLSVGISLENCKDNVTFDEMYRSADTALYTSKRNGKNRTSFSTRSETPESEADHE